MLKKMYLELGVNWAEVMYQKSAGIQALPAHIL
jgi:hypothetical protein